MVSLKFNIMHEGAPTDSATIQPVRSSDVPKSPWMSLSRPRNSWSLSERWEVGNFGEKLENA